MRSISKYQFHPQTRAFRYHVGRVLCPMSWEYFCMHDLPCISYVAQSSPPQIYFFVTYHLPTPQYVEQKQQQAIDPISPKSTGMRKTYICMESVYGVKDHNVTGRPISSICIPILKRHTYGPSCGKYVCTYIVYLYAGDVKRHEEPHLIFQEWI